MSDEAIDEFVGITQASSAVAKQFLGAFNGDVQAAVEAFFEDPEKYENGAQSSPIDPDLLEGDVPVPGDYVRAPMQQVRKRLIADDMPVGRGRGRPTNQPTEVFRDLRKEQNALFSGRPLNKKASGLADLFRPPLDVLFKGSYEKAISTAISKSKWLLVNVQDPGIFDCQLLNRDTWSDEGVKAILKASFIMVQLYIATDAAIEYTDWHKVNKTPHIAILDPETGERMWFHEGLLNSVEMCKQLASFLKEHPWDLEGAPDSHFDDIPTSKKRFEDMTEDEQMAMVIAASLDDAPPSEDEEPAPAKKRQGAKRTAQVSHKKIDISDSDEDFVVLDDSDSDKKVKRGKRSRVARNTASNTDLVELSDSSDEWTEKPEKKRAILSEPSSTPTPASKPVEPEIIDDLPPMEDPETLSGPPDCTLQIRLPNGTSVVQQFHSVQKLASVLRFARNHMGRKTGFALAATFPRRLFAHEELKTMSLKDASLTPRAVIVVEELDPTV
jgi:hypothetical protein